MPQMFSFPSFSMPIFSPFSMMSGYSMPSMGENIFSMANYSMPMFNPMMNFGLPAMFEQMNLLNKYTNNFGSLTSSLNNGTNTTSKTKKGQKTQKSNSKYNKNVEFEYEKIKSVDDNYKTDLKDDVLKIYVPETLPSFKNLKTHTYKRMNQEMEKAD